MMRDHRRDELGFTLAEMLVVLLLVGVVGGIVTTAVVTTLQSATASTNRVLALNELETAMQRMVRDMRSADVIDPGDGLDDLSTESYIRMNVYRDGEFNEVIYEVVDDRLIRRDTTQVLVASIDNEAFGEPVFAYFDREGDPACDPSCSGASTVEIRLVRAIEGRSPVITETRANIRNVRYRGS